MKSCTFPQRLLVCTGALFCLTVSAALAADNSASPPVVVSEAPAVAPSVAPAPAPSDAAPVRLPYGVEDVLKLSHAQISDDIIQNYVQSSGNIYNLTPNEIVYLRNQGVSDRVVAAMLNQRKQVSESVAQNAPAPAPAPSSANTAAAAPTYNYAAAPTDAQPQPASAPTVAPSTVYTIPYPQATAAYYGYPYPAYYSPYYSGGYYGGGYWGPGISLGFAFGSGWGHSGGHWGGWHGGTSWHGSGGWHGGSHGHH
jgi:hypothetical protein